MGLGTISRPQLFLLLLVISLTGCSAASQTAAPAATGTRRFVLSPQPQVPTVPGTEPVLLYEEEPPEGFPADAAHIMTAVLEKDILKIQVTYQGDCREHVFKLYAWTAFLQSNPPQGMLSLSHDARGDTCTTKIEKSLAFNLAPLDQERNDPSEHPLLLRIIEPAGGSFASQPYLPLMEWP